MNQANLLLGYEVITMIIVLVTTKEKSLGTNLNQENWMLVIRLWSSSADLQKKSNVLSSGYQYQMGHLILYIVK